jgi:hypothetical protein
MIQKPSYYRARIQAFLHIIQSSSGQNEKNSPDELLRYGFVHDDIKDEVDSFIKEEIQTETESNKPLSFTELTAFNTWFAMHPEKIAGKELLTSSREFPITIKGTKEDIINCISKTSNVTNAITTNNASKTNNNTEKRIRLAKAKAQAKLKLHKLLN